jgi:hypothetical protein
MSDVMRRLLVIGLALAVAGCGEADPVESQMADRAEIDFADAPKDMDAIECGDLLTEGEIERILGEDVTPLGRFTSSCYWTGRATSIQLVFNTRSPNEWRAALLETYTDRLPIEGVDVWAEPNSESIAAFGPARGALVHGVNSRDQALEILLLALSRL